MTSGNRDDNETARYTANLVDTGIFRAIGKPPNEQYDKLRAAVASADTRLHIPATIYEELGGDTTADAFPSGSEYVDEAIRDGWVIVADQLPGSFADDEDITSPVERSRHDAHRVIANVTNHPKTVNQWDDTALVGLAVRLFEQNERIRVLVHTTDRALSKAVRVVVPQYGYYEVKCRYYPPQTVKDQIGLETNLAW